MANNPFGYNDAAWVEICAREQAAKAERLRKEAEEKAKNHAAWLRLCGSVAPIGRLVD